MNNLNINRLLVWLTISFVSGLVLGFYTDIDLTLSISIFAIFFILGCFNYCFNLFNSKKIIIYLLIFVLGVIWLDWYDSQSIELQRWEKKNITLMGEVVSLSNSSNHLVVEINAVDNIQLRAKPKILVKEYGTRNLNYKWGDQVRLGGYLLKTTPQTNPGGFSEEGYWRLKGIKYKLSVSKQGKILVREHGFRQYLNQIRETIYTKITQILPGEESGVILGLILGDKSQIADNVYENAQKLGIAHVFAVSGLHVGILLGLYLLIMGKLGVSDNLTLLGAAVLLAFYCLLTGLTASVIRASLMAIFTLLSIKWLKFKDFYTILALAALIILLFNPMSLFTAGFQLSFAATWGLVYFLPVIRDLLVFLPEKIRNILAVPVAAQLATLPIVAYHFNFFSLWAPLANILIVPLIGLLVPLLLLGLVLAIIWIKLAEPFLYLAGGIIYILQLLITKLPTGHMYVAQPSIGLVLIYFVVLIVSRELKDIQSEAAVNVKRYVTFILVFSILFMTLPKSQPLTVTFLDVGQGDGTVIETPLQQYIVVDGGPSENTLARYLQFKGVNQVYMMILSHPDNDHIQGLFKVIQDIPTKYLLVPPDVENKEALRNLKEIAISKKVKIIEGKANMDLEFLADLNIKISWPEKEKNENLDTNNASLVFQLSHGSQDILFTGDVDSFVLKKLVSEYKDVEIFKVPHHGSKNSYYHGFYTNLDPQIAVVSVGRGNKFGHPAQKVITALIKNKTEVFRTDQEGAITIKLDGEKIWVDTMLVQEEGY